MNRPLVSYAQNREDLIIEAFFPDVNDGFYVDVGANHPLKHSVTKLFYKKGWHGINLEPNASLWDMLQFDRGRDANLNVGVSNKSGTLTFTEYANHGLSTFSDEMREAYTHQSSVFTDTFRRYEVPVRTLTDIFKEQAVSHIHFMKVDVEGFEYEVLEGNDWDKYRPEMICIESNHIVRDWRPILKKQRYSKVFNDGLNDYYLAEEALPRAEAFSYAKRMLESGEVVTREVYDHLQTMEQDLDLAALRLKEAQRLKTLAEVQSAWYERAPLKWMLKKTLRAFDRAMTNRLDRQPELTVRYDTDAAVALPARPAGKKLQVLNRSYAGSVTTVYPTGLPAWQKAIWLGYRAVRKIARLALRTVKRGRN